jgi:hypothetical protein
MMNAKSEDYPPLIRNTAIDVLTSSVIRADCRLQFLNECARDDSVIDGLMVIFFRVQASDIDRAEQILLAVQCISTATTIYDDNDKIVYLLRMLDKLLLSDGIQTLRNPLLMVKAVTTVLIHCSQCFQSSESLIVLGGRASSALRSLCAQSMYGGAKEDCRDKIFQLLMQFSEIPSLCSVWYFEAGSATSRETGQFLQLVLSLCCGEIHLLYEEALYLALLLTSQATDDDHMTPEKRLRRWNRCQEMIETISCLYASLSQILLDSAVLHSGDPLIPVESTTIMKTSANFRISIAAETLLHMRDSFHKFTGDSFEFAKEFSSIAATSSSCTRFQLIPLLESLGKVLGVVSRLVCEDESLQDAFLSYVDYFVRVAGSFECNPLMVSDALMPALFSICQECQENNIDRLCGTTGLMSLLFAGLEKRTIELRNHCLEASSLSALAMYLQVLETLFAVRQNDIQTLLLTEGYHAFTQCLGIEDAKRSLEVWRSVLESVVVGLSRVKAFCTTDSDRTLDSDNEKFDHLLETSSDAITAILGIISIQQM